MGAFKSKTSFTRFIFILNLIITTKILEVRWKEKARTVLDWSK